MENIIFNDRTNSKSYFDICFKNDDKKIKFENIFAIKDYVIIKIKNNEKLFTFKGVASNSNCFTFFKFFILPSPDKISNFCATDRNNLFFVQNNKFFCFDLDSSVTTISPLIIENNENISLKQNIIFTLNECFSLNSFSTDVNFGFLVVEDSLQLIYQKDKNDKKFLSEQIYQLIDESEEIIDIQYSTINGKEQYLIIILFTNFNIYYKTIFLNPNHSLQGIISTIKDTLFISLYKENITDKHYLFSVNHGLFESIIVLFPSQGKISLYFLQNNDKFLLEEKDLSKLLINGKVITDLLRINKLYSFDNSLYFEFFDGTIIEVIMDKEINKRKITLKKEEDGDGINNVIQSIICENNLFVMYSNNNVCIIRESKKTSSSNNLLNLTSTTSLISLAPSNIGSSKSMNKINPDINLIKCSNCELEAKFQCDKCKAYFSCQNPSKHREDWESHVVNCPAIQENEEEKEEEEEIKKHKGIKFPSLPENNKLIISPDSPELKGKTKDFKYKFVRALSSKIPNSVPTTIGDETQSNSTTPNKKEKELTTIANIINFQNELELKVKVIEFFPSFHCKRKEIIILLNSKKYIEAIDKSNSLLINSEIHLTDLINSYSIIPFALMESYYISKFSINDISNSYLYYEEHFCNILLSLNIFTSIGAKAKITRILDYLVKELEHYNIAKIIEMIIPSLVPSSPNALHRPEPLSEQYIKNQSIYYNYLKIILVIAEHSVNSKEFLQYEKYLLSFIQKVQSVFYTNIYLISNMYLLLGNLYMKINELKKSHILYEAIISKNNMRKKEEIYECLMCAYYNSGIIYHIIGKCEIARQRLENAAKIKVSGLKEKDAFLADIYETICEITIEKDDYSDAYKYLKLAIETKEISSTNRNVNYCEGSYDNDDPFWKKINILKEAIEKKAVESGSNINLLYPEDNKKNNSKKGAIKTDDAEDDKLINDFLTETFKPSFIREINQKELKAFYLFIASLTRDQIKKLNLDQPKDTETNKKLPILFTNEFKEILNHKQRVKFCELNLTGLSRMKVLKNYNKKIKLKNLNFDALYGDDTKMKTLKELKVNYDTKYILHNWEIDPNATNKLNNNLFLRRETLDILSEKMKKEQKRKISIQNMNALGNINTKEKMIKQKLIINEIFGDKNFVNFDKLKEFFINFCNENIPNRTKVITDDFVMFLSREMDKENLKKIIINEEIIPDILDTYEKMNITTN